MFFLFGEIHTGLALFRMKERKHSASSRSNSASRDTWCSSVKRDADILVWQILKQDFLYFLEHPKCPNESNTVDRASADVQPK